MEKTDGATVRPEFNRGSSGRWPAPFLEDMFSRRLIDFGPGRRHGTGMARRQQPAKRAPERARWPARLGWTRRPPRTRRRQRRRRKASTDNE